MSYEMPQTLDVAQVCEFEFILPYLSTRRLKTALCIIITCMDNLRNFFDAVFLHCGLLVGQSFTLFIHWIVSLLPRACVSVRLTTAAVLSEAKRSRCTAVTFLTNHKLFALTLSTNRITYQRTITISLCSRRIAVACCKMFIQKQRQWVKWKVTGGKLPTILKPAN